MEGFAGQVGRIRAGRRSGAARWILAAGLLAGLGCGSRPTAGSSTAPRPAGAEGIGRLDDAFLGAYNQGNAESLAALFTEDGILVPPDEPTCEGREEIEGYFDDLLREVPATAEFEVLETNLLDGWAFERIDVTVSWTDSETGEEIETWERYFWVLQRQPDGDWKIARLIVNSEDPEDDDEEEGGEGRRT